MIGQKGASTLIRVSLLSTYFGLELPIVLTRPGFCKRGQNCWFLHISDGRRDTQVEDEEEFCSICFEKPSTYGLLGEY